MSIVAALGRLSRGCSEPDRSHGHGSSSTRPSGCRSVRPHDPLVRKTWTFLGSDRGGPTAAVLYSLTGACKHLDIDPFAFLADVLRRLHSQPAGRLDELLPDVWFASHPAARRKTAA